MRAPRATALALAAAAALAAASGAAATGPHGAAAPADGAVVDMPGRQFTPSDVTVVVGQSVTWRNGDSAAHDISGDIDAGRVPPGASLTRRFDVPGHYAYFCRVHRSMRGSVDVVAVDLRGPEDPVRPGDRVELDAVAPHGSGVLRLERLREGAAPEVVAEAALDGEGRARFVVGADEPGRYRARLGELVSRVAAVRVAPRLRLEASRHGRSVRVRATVEPAAAARELSLRDYVRERFDYLPLRRLKVRADGTVAVRLRTARRLRLRVEVADAAPGWSRSASAPVVVLRLGDRGRGGSGGGGHGGH